MFRTEYDKHPSSRNYGLITQVVGVRRSRLSVECEARLSEGKKSVSAEGRLAWLQATTGDFSELTGSHDDAVGSVALCD